MSQDHVVEAAPAAEEHTDRGQSSPAPGRRRRRIERIAAVVALVLVVVHVLVLRPIEDAFGVADHLWAGGILLAVFVVMMLILRRAALALALAVLLTGAGLVVITPRFSGVHSGDAKILNSMEMFGGFHHLSAAVVDLNQPETVRFASIGSSPTAQFEVGSVSKALTGLVIADAVQRGEIDLSEPASAYLPPLDGSAAGAATLRELVTHHSGLSEFGAATIRKAYWTLPFGRNFLDASPAQLTQELRSDPLPNRGTYAYSSLGSAEAGQATAAAAGMSYPDLMQARLFGPLGMTGTAVQITPMVTDGRSLIGRPMKPWVMTGYASAGGVVSTAQDLARLAAALLEQRAPGMQALAPMAPTDQSFRQIGMFWMVNHWNNGQVITWHSGGTAGYTAWIGLDIEHQKAAVVLSDDAKNVQEMGEMLLYLAP